MYVSLCFLFFNWSMRICRVIYAMDMQTESVFFLVVWKLFVQREDVVVYGT